MPFLPWGGAVAAKAPPILQPTTSIVAKSLHSFWWASRLYVSTPLQLQADLPSITPVLPVVVPAAGEKLGACASALVYFDATAHTQVLVFGGDLPLATLLLDDTQEQASIQPDFLAEINPKAEVHAELFKKYRAVMGEPQAAGGAPDQSVFTALNAVGGTAARNIMCTGFGIGGALATLAAAEIALRCPTADVSCFAHGSPLMCNGEFAATFTMLVGQSLRTVHTGDPLTSKPVGRTWTSAPAFDVLFGELQANPADNHRELAYLKGLLKLGKDKQSEQGLREAVALNNDGTSRLGAGDTTVGALLDGNSELWQSALNPATLSAIQDITAEHAPVDAAALRPSISSYFKSPTPLFDGLAWVIAKMAASQTKGQVQSDQPTEPKLIKVSPLLDLVGNKHALDLRGSHRLPEPLHLSSAAYKDSSTSKKGHPLAQYDADDEFHSSARDVGIEYFKLIDDREFDHMPGFTPVDAQAYVCYRPEDRTAIFAFRGTTPQQRMDWAADLNLKKVELPQSLQLADRGILLHQGFWNQFYSLAFQGLSTDAYAPDLAHTLLELMEKAEGKPATGPPKAPNRIICCGHSLGGALASLGALWAAEVWPLTPVSVFTFGQPRVGNDKFVEVLQGVTSTGVRAVHHRDPVPLVPPHLNGFTHWYSSGYQEPAEPETATFSLALRPERRLKINAGDHDLGMYHKRLAEYLGFTPEAKP